MTIIDNFLALVLVALVQAYWD